MREIVNFRLLLHSITPASPTSSSSLTLIFSTARRLAVRQSSRSRSVSLFSYRNTPKRLFSYRKDYRVLSAIFAGDTVMAGEEAKITGFNKRRAEGTGNDKCRVLRLKSRKLNPINTVCFLQILGIGMDTQDTSPSVLLFFDRQRFIFNAGEGLQRFCAEHKVKLSKIDHVLLTRVCSETTGGLPGLLLTLAGLGDTGMSVKISGPSDLGILVNAMKAFIPNSAMIHTISFGPPNAPDGITVAHLNNFSDPREVLNDELVNISAILLLPCFLGGSHCTESDKTVIKPGDISVVYICQLPEIKGTFYPEKATALGLKPGPKYRELQFGRSVKSDKFDLTVHPSDVMEPSIPGPVVILIDCPTEYHLRGLLSIQTLNRYYTDSTEYVQAPNCIIHLSPRSVTSLPDYVIWMKRFGEAQHVMAGHEVENIVVPILQSSARITTQLSYLCPQFFPARWLLHHTNESVAKDILVSSEGTVAPPFRTIPAENLLKFHLRPYKNIGIDRSSVPTLNLSEVTERLILDNPNIVEAARKLNQLGSNAGGANGNATLVQDGDSAEQLYVDREPLPSCLEDVSREDMEIILLGTGSSHPSKYRNVSSIYVNLFSRGSLLLDCGEGTLGQLRRRFGLKGADDAVKSLRIIWISHIHADHHTGLARILSLRRQLLGGEILHERLLVIGPEPLRRFLNAYQILEDLGMQFIDCRKTAECNGGYGSSGPCCPTLRRLNEVLHDAGLETLTSFPVVHCPNAFGVAITASERVNTKGEVIPGWKVVYSGDTRPCTEVIEAARGATVLIHEATLEEGMEEEAIEKNHSTTKEAVQVGASSGAYRVILTHFSQRYPKIPVFSSSCMGRTCVGFDLMSVNLADLPMLPMIMPYLKLLFRDDVGVDDLDSGEDAMAVDLM